MNFEPGLHKDVPESEYHSHLFGNSGPLLSSSGLKQFMKSPAHFRMFQDFPSKSTRSMMAGSAFHKFVLEHSEFRACYAIAPDCDKRTKAGKQAWSVFTESVPHNIPTLTHKEGYQIKEMASKVARFWPATEMLTGSIEREITALWSEKGDIRCKARLDVLGNDFVADLKIACDPSQRGFTRAVIKYRYDIQAAFYCRAASACTGKEYTDFRFIVVGSGPPHDINVFRMRPRDIKAAWQEIEYYLEEYRECCDSGKWHGDRILDLGNDERELTFEGQEIEL